MRRTLFVTSCVLLCGCTAFPQIQSSTSHTYFPYDQKAIDAVPASTIGSEQATAAQFLAWDTRLMDMVRDQKMPPTEAARLYASVAVAQQDALLLGTNAAGIDSVGALVTCGLVPKSCSQTQPLLQNDPRDLLISSLVSDNIQKRFKADQQKQTQLVQPKKDAGQWAGPNPLTPNAGSWSLWSSGALLQIPPPPKVGSPEEKDQLQQIKNAMRAMTPQQMHRIGYWMWTNGSEATAGQWLQHADNMMIEHGISDPKKVAQIRATLTAAMADATVNCWRAKFQYWAPTPNQRDTAISPMSMMAPSPAFPDYPSQEATVSAAAAGVLSQAFPDASDMLAARAREAANSQVWGGLQFPIDSVEGLHLGELTATRTLADPRFALPAQ